MGVCDPGSSEMLDLTLIDGSTFLNLVIGSISDKCRTRVESNLPCQPFIFVFPGGRVCFLLSSFSPLTQTKMRFISFLECIYLMNYVAFPHERFGFFQRPISPGNAEMVFNSLPPLLSFLLTPLCFNSITSTSIYLDNSDSVL